MGDQSDLEFSAHVGQTGQSRDVEQAERGMDGHDRIPAGPGRKVSSGRLCPAAATSYYTRNGMNKKGLARVTLLLVRLPDSGHAGLGSRKWKVETSRLEKPGMAVEKRGVSACDGR
jgi:hypothetical protein